MMPVLLEHSPEAVHVPDGKGRLPMHLACATGRLDTAQLLVYNGASVSKPDASGLSPLHHANAAPETVASKASLVQWLGACCGGEGETSPPSAAASGSCGDLDLHRGRCRSSRVQEGELERDCH